MRLKSVVCLIFGVVLASSGSVHAEPVLHIYTHDVKPVISVEDQTGFGFEIIEKMMQTAGLKARYHALPWQRSVRMTQKNDGALIFPVIRWQERSEEYEWTVPLFEVKTFMIARRGTVLTGRDLTELSVGVAENSGFYRWLKREGYTKIFPIPEGNGVPLKLLFSGRFDAWFAEETVLQSSLEAAKLTDQVQYSNMITTFDIYLASNRTAPTPHGDELRAAFNTLKAAGNVDEILQKYGRD